MKKLLLSILTLVLGTTNYFGQCNVTLTSNKQKFCSDENATLLASPSDLKNIPDFSDSKQIFDLKDLNLTQQIIGFINNGTLTGLSYPIDTVKGSFNMNIPGVQLKNATVTSGKIKIGIETDLKQDLKIYFQLPYFKINGKPLTDSIFVTGVTNTTSGMVTFSKELDLTNAIIDFSAGNPSLYNIVYYKVKPSIKITTKILTGSEIGNLKIDLKGLTFAENISYKWFLNDNELTDKNTPNIDVNKSGIYKVITTSNCGTVEDTFKITVVERPSKEVSILGNLIFCEGDSLKLLALGKGSYKWSNNDITEITVIKKTGDYYVTVTNDICSSTSDNIKVTVNENPTVKLNHKDTTIIIGSELVLKATGAKDYEWNDQSTQDFITVKDAGLYSVIGKNEFGCTSTASIKIEVREKGASLLNVNKIKVAVSPNPSTDLIHITVEDFKNKTISLIDLKGNIVFSQDLTSLNSTVSVNSFAKGVYLLNIIDDTKTVVNVQRIVIE